MNFNELPYYFSTKFDEEPRRSLFLVRRASENASHLVVRSTEKRVAVASERPVHPRVGEGSTRDKFRVSGTKEMVEGAGANKESGGRFAH